jgi:hypothetical protein
VTHGRGLWVVLGVLLAAAALGACGDEDDEPAAPRTTSTPSGAVELSIRYDDGAAGKPRTASLSCGDGGRPRAVGFLDGKAPASELCAAARSLRALLTTPPDKGRMCTQIYGGPETAHVTGTIDGDQVDRRFTRTNGCEIADFQRAAALLQP